MKYFYSKLEMGEPSPDYLAEFAVVVAAVAGRGRIGLREMERPKGD